MVRAAPANLLGVADRAFLGDLVSELAARPDVDAERVYLTGFSNGALMVYALACELPGRSRRSRPWPAPTYRAAHRPEPRRLLHQHGPDLIVPDGGGWRWSLLSSPFLVVPHSVAAMAAADGRAPEPRSSQGDGVQPVDRVAGVRTGPGRTRSSEVGHEPGPRTAATIDEPLGLLRVRQAGSPQRCRQPQPMGTYSERPFGWPAGGSTGPRASCGAVGDGASRSRTVERVHGGPVKAQYVASVAASCAGVRSVARGPDRRSGSRTATTSTVVPPTVEALHQRVVTEDRPARANVSRSTNALGE